MADALVYRVFNGGALEGASQEDRETFLWQPSMGSPDRAINGQKELADARGLDTARNYGYVSGGVSLHMDGIVGAQYRLNAQPNYRFLSNISRSYDDEWAEEFGQTIEQYFRLLGDSNNRYLDAAATNTFTAMIRLAVGIFTITGETLATVEWLKDDPSRPVYTAIQMLNAGRLCNPQGLPDTDVFRAGIERNSYGAPQFYNFRLGDKGDPYAGINQYTWRRVPARKPWGRTQVIHILEQRTPDQSRGIADIVSALKTIRMTRKFADVTLQSAVINATYAAAIESELPPDAIAAAMGGAGATDPSSAMFAVYKAFMGALGGYLGAANSINIDGAKIPHLFPGTKLNMMPAKTAGGIGTGFEESLLRHVAASLGLSYEELTRDFSKTNYSSGRAAMGVSARFQASRKKHVADRFASEIYALVLEELMGNNLVPLPRGRTRDDFYEPLAKEAFTQATWIGSGYGQVDELKETQAAGLRVAMGLSTRGLEAARLGYDIYDLYEQRAREVAKEKELGLTFDTSTIKPNGVEPHAAPATVGDNQGADA